MRRLGQQEGESGQSSRYRRPYSLTFLTLPVRSLMCARANILTVSGSSVGTNTSKTANRSSYQSPNSRVSSTPGSSSCWSNSLLIAFAAISSSAGGVFIPSRRRMALYTIVCPHRLKVSRRSAKKLAPYLRITFKEKRSSLRAHSSKLSSERGNRSKSFL